MEKTFFLSSVLLMCVCAAAPAADAPPAPGPVFQTLGDSSPVPTEKAILEALDRGAAPRMDLELMGPDEAPAAGGQAMSPEQQAQLKAAYEQSIAGLEKALADIDPKKDAESHAAISKVLDGARADLARINAGVAPQPAGGGGAPAAKRLQVPVVPADRAMTRAEALASLRKVLELNCSPEALRAFVESPDSMDARRAAGAGAAAIIAGRPLAALAALLRAHELEPAKGAHLVNLAGVTALLGLPRHTLALLDGLEFVGTFGVPGRAMILTTRGHALVRLKRHAEAEQALREAVKLSPELSEARINLAHALYGQDDKDKKAEAVRFLGFARRRATIPDAKAAVTPPPLPPAKEPERPAGPHRGMTDDELAASADVQRAGRPPAAQVFDMSRGKRGSLPSVKIPRTIGDGAVLYDKFKKFHDDLLAESRSNGKRMNELWDQMRARERSGGVSPASARRAHDAFWYIANAQTDPALRAAYGRLHRAEQDRGVGTFGGQLHNPFASHELERKRDEIIAAQWPDHEAMCAAMRDAHEPYHGSWQAPIRNLYTEAGQYYKAEYAYRTAVAANIADPVYHEYARRLIRELSIGRARTFLHTLIVVTRWDRDFAKAYGSRLGTPADDDITDEEDEEADACPHALRGEYKVKVAVGFVEVSGNCEKVAVEFSGGEWIKTFVEVEVTEEGEVSIFIGNAAEAGLPGVPVQVAVKSGAFIKFTTDGKLIDLGSKVTRAVGVGAELGVVEIGYEREIETEFGIIAALNQP